MLAAMERGSGLSGPSPMGHTPARMTRTAVTTELVTVLFTDIVSSTEIASEVGDKRWRALVAAHHGLVRQALKRYRGRELDTAGDGFFATFPRPADAIRCACEVAEGVRQFGLEIRAGLNLGEAEIMGGKVGGLVVNTGARIMAIGTAGEVLVSSTVRDAVAGKGLAFADHGVHQLKGIEGDYHVFVVSTVDERPLEPPLDPSEAMRRRQLPPPIPRSRRRFAFIAAAVAVAVVVGIAFAFSWAGGDEPKPEATATGASGQRAMTAEDVALADDVPDAFAESCVATEQVPLRATASVSCTDGEIEVTFDRYANLDDLENAFTVATAGLGFAGRSCRDAPTSTASYEVNGVGRGSVACWVDAGIITFSPTIEWTDTDLLVLGRATRQVATGFRGNAPDLSLYEWWSEQGGPTDTNVAPKDVPLEVPSGTFAIEITEDEVGAISDGKVDPSFLGTTQVVLDGDTFAIVYDDGGRFESDLLWGKGHRLITRVRGALGDDFTGQCPRFESWRWSLRGDRLVLSDPSPEPNCNALRVFLTFEPLTRV